MCQTPGQSPVLSHRNAGPAFDNDVASDTPEDTLKLAAVVCGGVPDSEAIDR